MAELILRRGDKLLVSTNYITFKSDEDSIVLEVDENGELWLQPPDNDANGYRRMTVTELSQILWEARKCPCACGNRRGGLSHRLFEECDSNPLKED